MKNINGRIATLIIRAQNASDGGKGKTHLVCNRRSYRDNCAGYGVKDDLIFEAIRLICQHDTDFKFAVADTGDWRFPTLIYFQTRINGVKYQVSFHSRDNYTSYKRRSFRIKWDHGDSRDSAVTIYRYYVPDGELGGDAYD